MTYKTQELMRTDLVGGYMALVEVTNEYFTRWLLHIRCGAKAERWQFYDYSTAKQNFEERRQKAAPATINGHGKLSLPEDAA